MCCMFSSYMSQFDLEYGVAGEPVEQWRICGGASVWLESGMMKGILSSDLAAGLPLPAPDFLSATAPFRSSSWHPFRNTALGGCWVLMHLLPQWPPLYLASTVF